LSIIPQSSAHINAKILIKEKQRKGDRPLFSNKETYPDSPQKKGACPLFFVPLFFVPIFSSKGLGQSS